ncbi:Gamma-aminobutyrate permease [Acidipropionibacterium jensenii]|uniref:Gamma-aminobutyrate permease n=2 Tax=Acidipropionibacterium jensenii TaxID=1749 RepID=A0A3S4UR31_9ACTN|nr:Gamma-aminobutyrate permease [Acidipropionibacterium jensenii]
MSSSSSHSQASGGQRGTAPAPRMKGRHLVMMSLGSAIGTGLFLGSGKGIAAAGPSVLVAYVVAGLVVIAIMRMLGEMVAAHPDSGAFSVYTSRAMGPAAGFAMGWVWWVELAVVVAAEGTAAAQIFLAAWPIAPDWLLTLVFMVVLTVINLLGVDKFGEFEFWFALIKVAAVVGFLVVGVLLLCGVLPTPAPGLSNFLHHGGFMPNGWPGVATGLLIVIFAFGGIEIVAVAAAETENPRKHIGKAINTIIWRILIFYMGSVAIMVFALPWDDPKLASSPFVAVLSLARIPGADAVLTLIIVLAILSSLNANLYGDSRMLGSLAQRGMAPQFMMRKGRRNVPVAAVLSSVAFGYVCVVLTYIWGAKVLDLLLNIVGSTIIVTYLFTISSQIILRRRAERTGEKLPFKMWGYPYLSWLTLAVLIGIIGLGMTDPGVRAQILATFGLTLVLFLIGIARTRRLGEDPFRPSETPSSPDDSTDPADQQTVDHA